MALPNPHAGEVALRLAGQDCLLVYDWQAIARLREHVGDVTQVLRLNVDPLRLAQVVAIGLARHHPELDANAVCIASPPLHPTMLAVERAMALAYWGVDGPPKPEAGADADANPPKAQAPKRQTWWPWAWGRRSAPA